MATTTRGLMIRSGRALHDTSSRASRLRKPSRSVGGPSATSASSFSVSMSCSARMMWVSTGLRWASLPTSILKSRAAAPVASTSNGRRMTGALGFVPCSTVHLARPMPAKQVSIPFSSRFVRALLWMAVRRRRASSKESGSEKRAMRLTGLSASSRSNAHAFNPCVWPGVRSSVLVLRSRYRRRRLRPEVSTRSFCHCLVARRTNSRREALGFGIGHVS